MYLDGSESADLPLLYRGIDEDGLDVWEAMLPDSRRLVGMHCDMMPATCALVFHLPGDGVE